MRTAGPQAKLVVREPYEQPSRFYLLYLLSKLGPRVDFFAELSEKTNKEGKFHFLLQFNVFNRFQAREFNGILT